MINVCVIGYGYWGPNLCRNFSNANGYSLKAICDLNPGNLTKAKKNFPSVSVYKNFKDALSHKKFELVVLATPTSTHYSLAKFILNRSFNLLVEKPLCLTVKDHSHLNSLAKKNKVKLFIDFPFIFSGSINYVKNLIKNKKFGKLKSIESYREQAPVRTDTNVLWDLSIHDVSIIEYLIGSSKLKITNIVKKEYEKNNYSEVQINLSDNKDLNIFIKNKWKSPTKIRLIKFVFDGATIYCDENETLYKIKIYKSVKNRFNQFTLEVPTIDLTEPLTNLANYILNILSKKKQVTLTDNFNISITKLMVLLDKK